MFWRQLYSGCRFLLELDLTVHPATQIVIWILLVMVTQMLSANALLGVATLLLLCAGVISAARFGQLVRRTRWILLSLLLIYAWVTPGEPLSETLGVFSPTREGLLDGLLQLTRLVVVLAGLAILLERLRKVQLIAGLYSLFAPLQWLGGSRERLAVRLALTLHYAEMELSHPQTWQTIPQRLFYPDSPDVDGIDLPIYAFGWRDMLLLGLAMVICGLAWL